MWRPKVEYYTIVTAEQLETIVPESVVKFMNYDKSKSYTLLDACFNPQELEDGTFMINIQLCSPTIIESNPMFENKCVKGFITEAGYNEAVKYYGEENIFEYEEIEIQEDVITFELE